MGDSSKRRIHAFAVDNLGGGVIAYGVLALLRPHDYTLAGVVLILTYFGYFLFCEALWARTPGKMLFDLRVRRLDGAVPGLKEAFIRTVLRLVEANPLLLGAIPAGLAVSFSKRRQRLGDRLAGTVVMRGKPAPPPDGAIEPG